MRALPLILVALLMTACGAAPSAVSPTATRAGTPDGLAALAKSSTPKSCVTHALKWGDKDDDGELTEEEFINLTALAIDGVATSERKRLADLDEKQAKLEKRLAADPDDESLKAEIAACEERRKGLEQRLKKAAKDRVARTKESARNFKALDADKSDSLDRDEILNGCTVSR